VNDYLYQFTYDAQRNPTSVWLYSWLNSSWTPLDASLSFSKGAGNYYYYDNGFNFTMTYRIVVTEAASEIVSPPATYSLSQNYPNPFNPATVVSFQLPAVSDVKLVVFDLLGREASVLVNERRNAGIHEVKFDGSNLASGVYFYRLQAGDFVQTKRLVLSK
jgi:hypothetical protein